MARGTTLTSLLAMLNGELGNSTATNVARDAELTVLLSNKQKQMASEYNWPFLERRWNAACASGVQFVGLPTMDDLGDTSAIDFEKPVLVEVLWNTYYTPVEYGIGSEQYNTLDFARGQQSDQIQRWRMNANVNEVTSANTYEVWPVPVTAQVMRFTGQRTLKALAVAADTADLDDMLLVLFVAAEKLARTKQADAALKMQAATRRLQWCKQSYPAQEQRRCLGAGNTKSKPRTTGMIILVR